MTLGSRIKLIRGFESQNTFGEKYNLSIRQISSYERDQVQPQVKFLIELTSNENISLNWLLTGNGPKHKDDPIYNDKDNNQVEIPLYDCLVSAGHGNQVFEDSQVLGQVPFDRNFLVKDMGLKLDKLSVIAAMGDSMEPAIKEGDWLLVDMREQTNKRDAIYIINFDECYYAKRLQFTPKGVYIRSDNQAYKEIFIPKEPQQSFSIIGRIVWMGKKL